MRLDLIGEKFGRLEVMYTDVNIGRYTTWVCECECGNTLTVKTQNLTQGKTRSCGCYQKEGTSKRFSKKRITRTCITCGKEFSKPAWKLKVETGKYCSIDCARKKMVGKSNPNWRGGEVHRKYKQRYYLLKTTYGITPEEYHRRLDDLKGCCEICSGSLITPISKQNFHIDHDHTSGKTRGFLCTDCNRLLGAAKDDNTTLSNAIIYLNKYSKE